MNYEFDVAHQKPFNVPAEVIEYKMLLIHGMKVMVDRILAGLYG